MLHLRLHLHLHTFQHSGIFLNNTKQDSDTINSHFCVLFDLYSFIVVEEGE